MKLALAAVATVFAASFLKEMMRTKKRSTWQLHDAVRDFGAGFREGFHRSRRTSSKST